MSAPIPKGDYCSQYETFLIDTTNTAHILILFPWRLSKNGTEGKIGTVRKLYIARTPSFDIWYIPRYFTTNELYTLRNPKTIKSQLFGSDGNKNSTTMKPDLIA